MSDNKKVENKAQKENSGKHKFSDTAAKILSILAAVILWFYVIDVQTTQYEKNFYGISVSIENFDSEQGLDIISGRDNTVDVVLRGTKAQINALNTDDIKASIDMSNVNEAGNYKLDVIVTVPSNISVVEKSVSEVSVDVDKTVGKTVQVELSTTYMLPDSYEFGEISISPKNIYISGPQDLVDSVVKGKVKLDLGTVENKITSKCSIILVDSNDNEISSPYIKMNESTVEVTVPVLKKERKSVEVQLINSDYNYEYTYSPETVIVKGEVNTVDSIDKIITEPLDVVKTGTTGVRLSLPTDVTAYDDKGNVISTINVTITKAQNKNQINAENGEVVNE